MEKYYLLTGKLINIKMSISPNLIYKLNIISLKVHLQIFVELDKIILLGIYLETIGPRIARDMLKKIIRERITLLNIRTYLETIMDVCESRSVVSDCLRLHGLLQSRTLEWVAFPFSRRSSHPRDGTHVSLIAGGLPAELGQCSSSVVQFGETDQGDRTERSETDPCRVGK